MSEELSQSETKDLAPELGRLRSLFKEETWTKSDPKALGPGTFQDLRKSIQLLQEKKLLDVAAELIKAHLDEQADSLYAQFLNGLISLKLGKPEAPNQFKRLIDYFKNLGKWSNVEYFSNLILEFTENRYALRSLAQSLENLGKQKNAMTIWENLARLDRDDAEIAQKVGEYLIMEGNSIKGLYFMRQAMDANIRKKEFHKLDNIWKTILEIAPEDMAYLEKIEKSISESRNQEKFGQLLLPLLEHYKSKGNEETSINIMKKILKYTPLKFEVRKELIALYEKIYQGHSRLEEILKISKLRDFKTPAMKAVEEFERHIALDKGNYVFHRSWGVGKINDIDNEALFINFTGKEQNSHRMAIQMALPSLQPLAPTHIWVQKEENRSGLDDIFKNDLVAFFGILFNSNNNVMSLVDIKAEICPDFIPTKDWTKWWTKARNLLKKDPKFGISVKKRDEFFLRDKPITFSEDILSQFQRANTFDKKVNIAYDFIANASDEDLLNATLPNMVDYFMDSSREKESSKMIASLFTLYDLQNLGQSQKEATEEEAEEDTTSYLQKVKKFIKQSSNLATVARGINNQEIKKNFLQLIQEDRDDWPMIFIEVMFETPIKIHKFTFAELMRREEYNAINLFIERAIAGYKENPDIFLWVAKNLTQNVWNESWLNYSFQDLLLYLMRLMLQLPRIEPKGTKLKNSSIDILTYNNFEILRDCLEKESDSFNTKIFDLARGLSILTDTIRAEIQGLAAKYRPDLKNVIRREEKETETEERKEELELFFVSKAGYDAKVQAYNDIVQNEIPAIAKEIGRAAEYGDLRENAEYKAALDKQATLKATVFKLKEDLDKARVMDPSKIDTSVVGFGIKMNVLNLTTKEDEVITILGPWDADHSRNIISYKAPLGRAFLGKKAGEEINFNAGSSEYRYRIIALDKAL